MNCTSAGEDGGNVALVDGGKVFVGWPGAPGWTTTGVLGSACCAKIDSDNKHARVAAGRNLRLNRKYFIGFGFVEQRRFYLITKRLRKPANPDGSDVA
jgi:hypothetical protein